MKEKAHKTTKILSKAYRQVKFNKKIILTVTGSLAGQVRM